MWMRWPLTWSAGQTTPEGFSLIYFEISKWLTKEEAQRVHHEKELSRNEAPSVQTGGRARGLRGSRAHRASERGLGGRGSGRAGIKRPGWARGPPSVLDKLGEGRAGCSACSGCQASVGGARSRPGDQPRGGRWASRWLPASFEAQRLGGDGFSLKQRILGHWEAKHNRS